MKNKQKTEIYFYNKFPNVFCKHNLGYVFIIITFTLAYWMSFSTKPLWLVLLVLFFIDYFIFSYVMVIEKGD